MPPKCQKWKNNVTLYWNDIMWKSPWILCLLTPQILKTRNFLITEKTENIFQILIFAILNYNIHFSGKILSGILMWHMFWCLVTSETPWGSWGSLNTRTSVIPKFYSKFCQKNEYYNLKFLKSKFEKYPPFSQ